MAKPIIITGRVPQPWRMLIHGVEGIGKSTFASRAPKPIFITTEDGTNELECDKFKRCTEEWEFNDCLQFLELEQHDYQTVVVDSLDWLERLWSDALAKEGIGRVGTLPRTMALADCCDLVKEAFLLDNPGTDPPRPGYEYSPDRPHQNRPGHRPARTGL